MQVKTFTNWPETAKFAKVFTRERFRYTVAHTAAYFKLTILFFSDAILETVGQSLFIDLLTIREHS